MSCLVRGSINIDEFYHVPAIVRPGQTISAQRTTRRLGGKGGNQARALASAGGLALMDGCVGDDAEGRGAVESLVRRREGEEGRVNASRVRYWTDGVTGKAIIQLAEDGENSIIILAGANYASLPPHSPLIPAGTAHLLLANEIPLADTCAYLRAAHAASPRVTTVWNPSPMLRKENMQGVPWECVDWLLVNADELRDLERLAASGKTSPSEGKEGIMQAYTAIAALNPALNVACTLGAEGVCIITAPSSPIAGPQSFSVPPGKLQNPVKDTTGAGDCFAGFFTAGLMRLQQEAGGAQAGQVDQKSLQAVFEECMTACAMCVEKEGAQDSYPTRAAVLERMQQA